VYHDLQLTVADFFPDSHFQINHLSQIHLALTLLPILQKTPSSRLAFQSPDLHRAAPPSTKFANVDEINKDIGPSLLYNRTKLAQILAVRAMTRRMEAKKLGFSNMTQVFINATHPGAVNTDQQEQAVEAYGTLGKLGVAATRPLMKDPNDQG
jgi:WW domain-containing oxidoreductase